MPRVVLTLGGVALAASLLALAFLIGRETGRADRELEVTREPVAPVAQPSSGPPAMAPATRVAAPPRASPPGSSPSLAPDAPRFAPEPSLSPPAPAGSAAARERDAVERYFREIESLGGTGAIGGSPNELAQALLSEGVQGNWSSFDKLIEDQRSVLSTLQRTSVPAACRTYHTRMSDLVREGIRMLEAVKSGLESGNVGGLQAVSAQAQALQVEAGALTDLGQEIKREYGFLP